MSKKANLLLVDDEERVVRTLKSLFRSEYKVFTSTNGNEAIEIVKNEPIQVVVSDQRMPLMTGVELLRSVKTVSPNTMRILLTGYADLAAIVGSVNEGEIFRYVNKPWVAEDLENTVRDATEIALASESQQKETAKIIAENHAKLDFLVIDDDENTFKVVKEIVGNKHGVHWACNVDAAFELLSREQVGIVITEVHIGDEDVTGPLKTLKQLNPNILALVLTSFQDTKALIDLINQGQIYRFLPKPIMVKMLERSIQSSLRHYQLLQTAPSLLKRHKVEKPQKGGFKLSDNIMGYLKKLRAT